jgi:hypothetical protein
MPVSKTDLYTLFYAARRKVGLSYLFYTARCSFGYTV